MSGHSYERGRAMREATAALRQALRGVELDAQDERLIAWLARWEPETVARVASLVERARTAAGQGR